MNLHVLTNFDTAARVSAVESLLLTPIHGVANRAISTAGQAISQTGEIILRCSNPRKSLPQFRRPSIRYSSESQIENREEEQSTERLVVAIQPRYDGEGIELVVNNDDGKENRQYHPMIRGSLLMIDPIGVDTEDREMFSMNLKVLRGKNLPFKNTRIRIGVLNRDGGIDQIIGTTPSSEGSSDPIWGSQSSSWTVNANHSTKFVFTLLPEKHGERKKKRKNSTPVSLCATASAEDLLSKRNPNFWIMIKEEENPNAATNYGRIQIRLTRPTEAKLQKQENCERITSGPAMPRMQSYAIRKMALYSCSPVMLNVYDVSKDPKIQTINNTTKSFGYGGIFHAAIEIHGKEYSFGGTNNKKSILSGVFQCPPKKCPMHHYRESVFLGDCELNSEQIEGILLGLRPKWLASSYNVFRRNCAGFSREFAIELGVGDLPGWVFSLASAAESIEPYLHTINSYWSSEMGSASMGSASSEMDSASPARKEPCKDITNYNSPKHVSTGEVRVNSHEEIEARHAAKNTQEALLDHAMAVRIQRAFRASVRRRANALRAKELRELQVPMVASA